jgi:V/A-type H+-transporting ATPase subunit I
VAEFEQASADLASVENRLAWLSGYVPEPKLADLRAAAVTEGWGLLVQDPGGEDTVPTLLYNPQPMRLVKPVMDFLGTVPGYRERDISFFFLIFFSVFFAMIIGDAGYGTLLFGVSVYFSLKTRRKTGYIPDGLILLVLMGFCTMVWGAITGNYFGFQPVSELWPLSQLVIPAISSWEERSTKTVQFICFIIGAIHLSIAHIWNFIVEIRRKPRIRAFSQLGSLFLVLGLYFVVLYMVLDPVKYPVPQAAIIMIVMGYVMVLFLSQQEGNFFMGLLKGLAGFIPTTLGSISVFADIISYIRLFAVGLAGIAIAQSFNDMARGIMTGPVGIVFGIVILVLGHSLNICMSMLSVVVHGIRLNVLEFSNHLGLEWSGFSYDPFRDKGENSPPNN